MRQSRRILLSKCQRSELVFGNSRRDFDHSKNKAFDFFKKPYFSSPKGKGGPFCSYKIADPIGTGEYIYLESCQYPGQCLAINEFGHPIPPQTNKGSPQAHYSVRLVVRIHI